MTHYSNTCLLLEWSSEAATPTNEAATHTNEAMPTTLGYRVYVNGVAEGQVLSFLVCLYVVCGFIGGL